MSRRLTAPPRPETPTDRRHAQRANADDEQRKESERLNALHAAVLETGRGPELLAYWRKITIEKATPGDIADGALQRLEANRNFVRVMEKRIADFHDRKQD